MNSTDEFDIQLAREYQRDPHGNHSPALRDLLTRMRSISTPPFLTIVATIPYKEYRIGEISGRRGDPVRIYPEPVFARIDQAEWHIFKLRWEILTGSPYAG